MISPLCVLRELVDWPRAAYLGRPVISGHRFEEQPRENGQACCVQVLRCTVCKHTSTAWNTCRCKRA